MVGRGHSISLEWCEVVVTMIDCLSANVFLV